jgi:hypothetical protein
MSPKLQQAVQDNEYFDPKEFPDGRVACLMGLLYTCAIIVLSEKNCEHSYDDRWCYCSPEKAKLALAAWDGMGEPTGWHRHPTTGRRRENGDPTKETINH